MQLAEDLADENQPDRVRLSHGRTLQLSRSGRDGYLCLLVHGFADGAYVWDASVRTLQPTFRTVAVDLNGHGESDWDAAGYNVASHTEDVNEIVNFLGERKIVLIGHSLGAHVATRIAALRSEHIAALVLVDFGPEMNSEGTRQGRENLRASLRLYDSPQEYEEWLRLTRPLISPDLVRELAQRALRPVAGGFRLRIDPRLADVDETPNLRNRQILWRMLEQIACPTLIVRGNGSAMFVRSVAQRMLQTMRHAQLATVACAGHAVMTDNPSEFNRVLLDFLSKTVNGSIGSA
jgi:pimeloyl-ACP methyl ester carboxylesterase